MLFTPAVRWIYLTFAVLCAVAAASEQIAARDDCDWYCWVGNRIDALTKQVDKLTKLLFPGDNNDVKNHPGEETRPSSTPVRVASTFGTPNASYNTPPTSTPIVTVSLTTSGATYPTSLPTPQPAVEDRKGYRAIAYFGNWDIYARKYFPQQIPASKLTHVLYSFADNKDDGTVTLADTWADTDVHYQGDSWSDSGKNVYGAMKQLGLLKQKNRNLKVMLSIGGWTYTNEKKHLDSPASSDQGRKQFAKSCVDMIKNYGFDGIDVDWEYPQNTEQGNQFLALLKEIRTAMDAYAESLRASSDTKGAQPKFLLSIAAPAGEPNYRNLPLKEIAQVLDFINLMAYDYSGSWDKTSGHASNLYASTSNPKSTPFNTDGVLKAYSAAGVPSEKINLGMPLYGRAFTNTAGLGQAYDGIGKGTWEPGVYDFKDMPLAGATEYYDAEAGATYSYDNSTRMLVSYDTVDMALKKVEYIEKHRLGGAMWWDAAGDRTDEKSIITNVVGKLAGSDGKGIESTSNWLNYPDSSYDNVKKGFSG